MSRRGLQLLLGTIGTVAAIAGARGVLRGSDEVLYGGSVSPNVDSEYRFYAAWYHVLGLMVLRASMEPESETVTARACAAGFLLAACGRMLSIRRLGLPHPGQRALIAVELLIAAILPPWQAKVARQHAERQDPAPRREGATGASPI